MTTYNLCEQLIKAKSSLKDNSSEAWEVFKTDMLSKIDVFLLADRLNNVQFNELKQMMD